MALVQRVQRAEDGAGVPALLGAGTRRRRRFVGPGEAELGDAEPAHGLEPVAHARRGDCGRHEREAPGVAGAEAKA